MLAAARAGDPGLGQILSPDPIDDGSATWTVACYQIGDFSPTTLKDFADPNDAVRAVAHCPEIAHVAAELLASGTSGLRWTAMVRTGDLLRFQLLTTGAAGNDDLAAVPLDVVQDRWAQELPGWAATGGSSRPTPGGPRDQATSDHARRIRRGHGPDPRDRDRVWPGESTNLRRPERSSIDSMHSSAGWWRCSSNSGCRRSPRRPTRTRPSAPLTPGPPPPSAPAAGGVASRAAALLGQRLSDALTPRRRARVCLRLATRRRRPAPPAAVMTAGAPIDPPPDHSGGRRPGGAVARGDGGGRGLRRQSAVARCEPLGLSPEGRRVPGPTQERTGRVVVGESRGLQGTPHSRGFCDRPGQRGQRQLPGRPGLRSYADGQCLQQFRGYVGVDYRQSSLYYTYLLPSVRSWASDDRTVVCIITTTGQQLTSSVKGSKR